MRKTGYRYSNENVARGSGSNCYTFKSTFTTTKFKLYKIQKFKVQRRIVHCSIRFLIG